MRARVFRRGQPIRGRRLGRAVQTQLRAASSGPVAVCVAHLAGTPWDESIGGPAYHASSADAGGQPVGRPIRFDWVENEGQSGEEASAYPSSSSSPAPT